MIGYSKTKLDRRRMLGSLGLVGLGLVPGLNNSSTLRAQGNPPAKPVPKVPVSAPPADVNDLSMEVAALRTLYLLKAGPDQQGDRAGILQSSVVGHYSAVRNAAKDCAQPARKRSEADCSKNYRKVLTELRAAFIVGQTERINELSDQIEELNKDEQPDLDDAVEVTDQARKNGPALLRAYFDANRIAGYIAAYGKDFPDTWLLLFKTIRLDGQGTKPSPEQWKQTRAFIIHEVSWQVGGLDANRQQKIGEQVAAILDRAYPLSNEELKKEGSRGGVGLRGAIANVVNQAGATEIIKHVVEQDIAEMLSNPRLLAAIDTRLEYLKK